MGAASKGRAEGRRSAWNGKSQQKKKTLPLNEDIIAWKTPAHNLNNTFQVFDITITACEERFDVN